MASIVSAGTTSGTSLNLSADTSGVLQLATNGTTTAVTIDTSQNVGIGTASPAQKLDVQAADYVAVRTLSTNSSIDTRLQSFSTGNYGYVGTVSNHAFSVITNNAERMRVTSAGIVGIGVTPATWFSSSRAIQLGTTTSFEDLAPGTALFNNAYRDSGGASAYSTTNAATRYVLSGGQHLLQSAASGSANTAIPWTQVLSVDLNNTVALQGATFKSGTGITFPATQSASSDANTLDDYEEGTWTPSFSASGATFTYGSERGGWYTKIGRMVTVGFTLSTTARSGGSGTITITGLPFTSGSISNGFSAGSVGTVNQWVHSGSFVQWGIRVTTATTSIAIFEFGVAGAGTGDTSAQVAIIPTGTTTNSTLNVTYYID